MKKPLTEKAMSTLNYYFINETYDVDYYLKELLTKTEYKDHHFWIDAWYIAVHIFPNSFTDNWRIYTSSLEERVELFYKTLELATEKDNDTTHDFCRDLAVKADYYNKLSLIEPECEKGREDGFFDSLLEAELKLDGTYDAFSEAVDFLINKYGLIIVQATSINGSCEEIWIDDISDDDIMDNFKSSLMDCVVHFLLPMTFEKENYTYDSYFGIWTNEIGETYGSLEVLANDEVLVVYTKQPIFNILL